MNRTNIEWAKNPDGSQGYTFNPLTGCLNHTPEGLCKGGMFPCYAYKLANGRLKQRYLANKYTVGIGNLADRLRLFDDPFYPRLWWNRLGELPDYWKQPDTKERGIFVCDMSDLFGIGIPETWTRAVLDKISRYSWHRFYLLTKQPQNLINFSPFPDNCWVGVTATESDLFANAVNNLMNIRAKVKYVSIEPLLSWQRLDISTWLRQIDWVIIGACTGTKLDLIELNKQYPALKLMPWGKKWTLQPSVEWVKEIVKAADQAGVRIFLKYSLIPILPPNTYKSPFHFGIHGIRQEMPA